MPTYEYWTHTYGDHYLVRLDEEHQITGVCGPMRQADIPVMNRHNYDYDAQPRHAAWIREHANEFNRTPSHESQT